MLAETEEITSGGVWDHKHHQHCQHQLILFNVIVLRMSLTSAAPRFEWTIYGSSNVNIMNFTIHTQLNKQFMLRGGIKHIRGEGE